MVAVAYTDCSYSMEHRIGACGWVILVDGNMKSHKVILVGNLGTSQEGELFSVVQALQECFLINGVKSIVANTDCQAVVTASNRKTKKHRMPKKYNELLETLEMIREYGIGVTITHVKAHCQNTMNNLIDKSSRKQLHNFIKTTNQDNE
jgi:ribonuclease HI